MSEIISFLVSVLASVVGYYICKWLDGDDSDNQPSGSSTVQNEKNPQQWLLLGVRLCLYDTSYLFLATAIIAYASSLFKYSLLPPTIYCWLRQSSITNTVGFCSNMCGLPFLNYFPLVWSTIIIRPLLSVCPLSNISRHSRKL